MRSKVIMYSFFILGISIILYPFIAKMITVHNQTQAISNYRTMVGTMSNDEKDTIKEQANNFNKSLYDASNFNVDLKLTNENATSYINFFHVGDMLGILKIPKLNTNIPIYEGTSDNILQVGIGHLLKTSMPTGGENTHSVLVGHTGLTEAKIFDELEKMQIGDEFYISCLDEILKYKVYNIQTVLPDEVEYLQIHKDEDLVTLVTCTPKYVNSHRLLVMGKREKIDIQKDEQLQEEIKNETVETEQNKTTLYSLILIIIAIIIALMVIKKITKGVDTKYKRRRVDN